MIPGENLVGCSKYSVGGGKYFCCKYILELFVDAGEYLLEKMA